MSKYMRRMALILIGVCAAALLAGCTAEPPKALVRDDAIPASALISAQMPLTAFGEGTFTLYFRYQDTGYLGVEMRSIVLRPDEPPLKALAQALADGPGASQPMLNQLFPAGTQVLSTALVGDVLYVTFSEQLLNRYADEQGDLTAGRTATEAQLRRKLAMAALTNTLTETGQCAQVQVLVQRELQSATSLRLPASYFLTTKDESPLGPFVRDESVLFTPHNTVQQILSCWLTQNWGELYDSIALQDAFDGSERPGLQAAMLGFQASKALTTFTASAGSVSLDGRSAIVCADVTLHHADGTDSVFQSYPIYLTRENGLWKASYSQLISLMNHE